MRLLITGGAGFIGANLCRAAVARDDEVCVLDDFSAGRRDNLDGVAVYTIESTVLDRDAVDDACRQADAVVHLAALASVPLSVEQPLWTHATNVTGTLNVLEAARRHGTHLVLASSSAVYGNTEQLPIKEADATRPLSPYAASKLAAEAYALTYRALHGLDVLALRFFNVYGPLQRVDHPYAAVVPKFISGILDDAVLPIDGDGTQTRDFVSVHTVVDVLLDAVSRRLSYGGPVNLAVGSRTSVNDLVHTIESVSGRTARIEWRAPRPGDVHDSQADTTLFTSLFPDIVAEPLDVGLKKTVAWFEEHRGDRP